MDETVQKKMSKCLPMPRINYFVRPKKNGCRFLWQVIKAHCPEEAAEVFCVLRNYASEQTGVVEVKDHGIFDIIYVPKATKRYENEISRCI